jgi:hypothetical protein
VDGFPFGRAKYPFAQMAAEMGVWRLDPAEFGVRKETARNAATKWANEHGWKATTIIEGRFVFVQFTKREG